MMVNSEEILDEVREGFELMVEVAESSKYSDCLKQSTSDGQYLVD